MKKRLSGLLSLGLSLAIFSGCNTDSPLPATAPTTSQTPEFITLPKRLDASLMKRVSVTKFIDASQGGTLRLRDIYRAAPDNHLVFIDIALEFKPNDLPYDASLTLSIDDVAFLTNVNLTFGPHGIDFNNPVKLTVVATGLDLNLNAGRIKLYYMDGNNVWTKVQNSKGFYYNGSLYADGMLSHFSQYAWGRINE